MSGDPFDGDGPHSDDFHGLLRTRRIEIVDECGLLRAVVGELPPSRRGAPDKPDFGVVLLDRHGRRRAWFALGSHGPVLGFDEEGNTAVEVGVDDGSGDGVRTGAYLVLNDGTGDLAVGWSVNEDGSAITRTRGRPAQ